VRPERQELLKEAESHSKKLFAMVAGLIGEADRLQDERDQAVKRAEALVRDADNDRAEIAKLGDQIVKWVERDNQAARDLAAAYTERDEAIDVIRALTGGYEAATRFLAKHAKDDEPKKKRQAPVLPPPPRLDFVDKAASKVSQEKLAEMAD